MTEERESSDPILRVEGVSLVLSGRKVLEDVSFSLRPGEFTGLIGANGAGKTSLLRVILGLQPPSAGRVVLGDGKRPDQRQRIGYVPQKLFLDPDIPVRARDLVGLGLDGRRLGVAMPAASRRQRIEGALASVDALHLADARVGNLSGGEQQRVMIAHALISGPRLLLLDEPLANLDIRAEAEVVQLLSRIADEQGIAILISAHDMNPLLPAMDRVVYMAAGRAASGPASEVVRSEVLSKLYGYHVDVLRVHGRIIVLVGPPAGGAELEGEAGPDVESGIVSVR
jgi:zinc/manganese transport system ATP-binding protein